MTVTYGGQSAFYMVNVKFKPEVVISPVSVKTETGKTVSFTYQVSGKDVKYQWYFKKTNGDWTLWKGHTASVIRAQTNDTWNHIQLYCIAIATDAYGERLQSCTVSVTLTDILAIYRLPSSCVYSNRGESAVAAVQSYGKDLSYQWYCKKQQDESFSRMRGKITSEVSFVTDRSWHRAKLRCVVTDRSGKSVTSQSATVILNDALEITKHPQQYIRIQSGDKATFTVYAKGKDLQYQWYYKKKGATGWSLWKGHTDTTTSATVNDTWDGMQVRCTITDSSGKTLTSSAATVTSNPRRFPL